MRIKYGGTFKSATFSTSVGQFPSLEQTYDIACRMILGAQYDNDDDDEDGSINVWVFVYRI